MKTLEKTDKNVKFVDNKTKTKKTTINPIKGKMTVLTSKM